MILLTGATGRVGTAAGKALFQAGGPFRVLVRDPEKMAVAGPDVQVVQGDLSDPASIGESLKGIRRALIVMGNPPDQAGLERQFASLAGA